MQELQDKSPEVYRCFVSGYNVVRRSDKFFAGIGTDLMIEQELMRSVKTTGGLTHGRGMTELQRNGCYQQQQQQPSNKQWKHLLQSYPNQVSKT